LIERNTVTQGDCLVVMREMPDNEVDAIVTDPPYGLSFMGKEWDHGIPGIPFWQEALRVSKPGAHMLAFGGTRTHHRLMVAIEDAGWEIRDTLGWIYGSGFPKSLNVQQAINKAANGHPQGASDPTSPNHGKFKGGCSDDNKSGRGFGAGAGSFMKEQSIGRGNDEGEWNGWGTALKPAWEPIILCRKPLEGTVAQNVLKWGTGGINIDGCRVEIPENDKANYDFNNNGLSRMKRPEGEKLGQFDGGWKIDKTPRENQKGRFPANLIHDGSGEVLALFPDSKGQLAKVGPDNGLKNSINCYGNYGARDLCEPRDDSGSAARFFYCAKADSKERNKYLKGRPSKKVNDGRDTPIDNAFQRGETLRKNVHPTVKPLALLQYLCRLITPPGGVVLDPFAGSGSTGIAAHNEGFDYYLIEIDPEYDDITRIRNAQVRLPL